MAELRVGDPLDLSTQVGPLATRRIRDEVHGQVEVTLAAGGRLLLGGEIPRGPGKCYPPTVIADVPADAPAARDEIFGPVAALFPVRDADEAIRLANATRFGLGSAAWTNDAEERAAFVAGIQAGQVFINGMVASDPRLPFGGIKESGYGRELGVFGLREFVNIKSVVVAGSQPRTAGVTE
jgi:succinate-semialdehyde dehydrogenase/glutarate-semialdehyde dehydrogenase